MFEGITPPVLVLVVFGAKMIPTKSLAGITV